MTLKSAGTGTVATGPCQQSPSNRVQLGEERGFLKHTHTHRQTHRRTQP